MGRSQGGLGVPRGEGCVKRGKNQGKAKVGNGEGAKGGNAKGTFSRDVPRGVSLRQENILRGHVKRRDWGTQKG